MDSFGDIFVAAKEYCKEQVAPATYELFFADLEPVNFENGKAVIQVRSAFIKGVLDERYISLLQKAVKSILGFDVAVEIVVEEAAAAAPAASAPSGSYDYTFENFIVGQNNKFAHAAALNVATNPSNSWNPLFIYGTSGLGKTHLLFAIQYEISKSHPDYKIVYVDGDRFTNEIINGIQEKNMAALHNKYRNIDVLLMDDVQFIGGKDSTQEEFFHTFNTLYNSGKQIVLASDRPPKEIKRLDERLRTRFEWGLTADIQPPDFETRVAIIRRKAALLNLDIPDDVTEYIANNLKDNIRQLEGAVKKLNAYYLIEDIQPVLSSAKKAIKDILSETQPLPVTIEKIINEVARTYNVTPEDIKSNKRKATISTARKIAMYCVREITGMSMEEIGAEFGGRDHSTVVYCCKNVTEQLETDSRVKDSVEDIIRNVKT